MDLTVVGRTTGSGGVISKTLSRDRLSFFLKIFFLLGGGLLWSSSLDSKKFSQFQTSIFHVALSEFSPAYAAMEDEFIHIASLELNPPIGTNSGYKEKKKQINHFVQKRETKDIEPGKIKIFHQIQGAGSLRSILNSKPGNSFFKNLKKETQHTQSKEKRKSESKYLELKGTQYAMKNSGETLSMSSLTKGDPLCTHKICLNPLPHQGSKTGKKVFSPLSFGPLSPMAKPQSILSEKKQELVQRQRGPEKFFAKIQNTLELSPSPQAHSLETNTLWASGPIELQNGLPFLGPMEVEWIVDGEKIGSGHINTDQGNYKIPIQKIMGSLVVSLYDTNNQLVGEGVADLEGLSHGKNLSQLKINVSPIDWDRAGEIIHIHSLGAEKKPVKNAHVELYAYQKFTQTNTKGEILFPDWRRSESNTLARASKEGFRDSIFHLNSKRPTQVLLFENSYMDAFFDWIEEDLGIENVRDKGTVYGSLSRKPGGPLASGYHAYIKDHEESLYFNDWYFVDPSKESTSSNGLFVFVGLESGSYDLIVEKNGFIVDEKTLSVENSSVSPIVVKLKKYQDSVL